LLIGDCRLPLKLVIHWETYRHYKARAVKTEKELVLSAPTYRGMAR